MPRFTKIERGLTVRRPQNEAEAALFDKMTAEGWTLTKRGWPDFFCINDAGEFCAVEVKPRASQKLKPDQLKVAKLLQAAGVTMYKWTPDGGFTDPAE